MNGPTNEMPQRARPHVSPEAQMAGKCRALRAANVPPELEAEARAHPPFETAARESGREYRQSITDSPGGSAAAVPLLSLVIRFTGGIDEEPDDDFDIDRLSVCSYWRCEMLFERKTANQRYCRKACRSRQNKWQRAQERRRARMAAGSPR